MKKFRLPGRAVFVVAVAMSTAAAVPSGASTRNYLTVEGRVFDHLGAPLPGTWVFCLGSRRASVPVDSLGKYRLEIPGATLEELERAPLKIRIQARRKGYRFALSNGAPELGIEMRVVKDESPLSRLRVRSNDSVVVSAIANSVVLDANPRALVTAMFVGSPGAQYDTPSVPLENADEITLAGDLQSIPELKPTDPTVGATVTVAPPRAAGTGATATVTPPAPKPQPSPAAPAHSTPARSAPPAASAPTSVKPPPTSPPAETPAASTEPRKWNAAGSERETAKPRVIRPAMPGHAPAEQSRTAPSAPAPSSNDTTRSARARTTSAPTDDPNLRPVLRKDYPIEPVSPGRQPPVQRVPSAPGVQPPRRPPTGAASPPPMCDCVIRGTVEVQWDRPLTSRTEVVIAVEDAPDVTTSAELFMGSPRAFEIHPAPCGVHRLLLWTRSRQRFVLVSTEPRVVCTPGGVQQMRLVLEPVARWGAPQ